MVHRIWIISNFKVFVKTVLKNLYFVPHEYRYSLDIIGFQYSLNNTTQIFFCFLYTEDNIMIV